MKAAIIHISDMHFSASSDVGLKRLEKLTNAILFARQPEERLVLAITGDIANTGAVTEFLLAEQFLKKLQAKLSEAISALTVTTLLIPGNHDCDFRSVGDVRPRLLERIASLPDELEQLDPSGESVRTLLAVQREFWDHSQRLTGHSVPADQQLFFKRSLNEDSSSIEFRCFNSAWLSQKHEQVGSLGFPKAILEEAAKPPTGIDLVISLIHHPSNWLSPSVHQNFRRVIQTTSDFLLSGHEHTQEAHQVSTFTGEKVVHLEAGPYQPANSGASEFSILHVDVPARTWVYEAFRWSEGAYEVAGSPSLGSWDPNSQHTGGLTLSKAFLSYLAEPGTGFLHPRKPNLSLQDVYVYPDLRARIASRHLRQSNDLPRQVRSSEVLDTVLKCDRIVLAGPSESGKTALLKMIYLDAHSKHGRFCLKLCGADFKGKHKEQEFKSQVDSAIRTQYGQNSLGLYKATEKEARVLLIDDWDETSLNREQRNKILVEAQGHFSCVVVFCNDIFLIEELARVEPRSALASYHIADIKEFGFLLRGRLAFKWHQLGSSYTDDEQELSRSVSESTRVIDTVLGRNLLPSYPVNILTLLQTYDASAGSAHNGLGSYGQVYEALITARLVKVSLKSIDIGTKITFLSRVAWWLFDMRRRYFGDAEWTNLVNSYFDQYRIRIDGGQLLSSLMDAGILTTDSDGYRFAYSYGYCYFVAKYFQENLADLEDEVAKVALFAQLTKLSDQVYNQENSNITIFYVFLTKDRKLISHVLRNARLIFAEEPEMDFLKDVSFANSLTGQVSPATLPSLSAAENQQMYDQRRDDAGVQIEPLADHMLPSLSYDASLSYEQKLIIGIRHLTLMGQILRNFPGSLKADMKLDLAFESYSLGLRLLGSVFSLTKQDAGALTNEISQLLITKMSFSGSPQEVKRKAEGIIVEMLREVSFGLLKRISHSIGLQELEETYREVSALRDHCLSSRLIDLSIHLDHFRKFPKAVIGDLAQEVKTNVFTLQTLRDLVLHHIYLFPEDYATQQWAGSTLDFQVNTAAIRGSTQKKLKAKV